MKMDLIILLALVGSAHSASLTFKVPDSPLLVQEGEDAVLLCLLPPDTNAEEMEVRWYRELESQVHSYMIHRDVIEAQSEQYRGRTSLSREELKKGNVSLQLREVRSSDEGSYSCCVLSAGLQCAAEIQLKVVAEFSLPTVNQDEALGKDTQSGSSEEMHPGSERITEQERRGEEHDYESWGDEPFLIIDSFLHLFEYSEEGYFGIVIGCVFIVALILIIMIFYKRKKEIKKQPQKKENTEKGKDELKKKNESLEKKINELKQERDELHKKNENTEKGKDELKKKNESLEKKIDELKQECDKLQKKNESQETDSQRLQHDALKKEKNPGKVDCDDIRVKFNAVGYVVERKWSSIVKAQAKVTLNPDTASPSLTVSEDSSQVRFKGEGSEEWPSVLGIEGFTSGRHYWEVEVGEKGYWALGVSSIHPNEKIIPEKPEEGYWLLRRWRGNTYEAVSQSPVLLTLQHKLYKVGMILDHKKEKLSFYNVYDGSTRYKIHTFNYKFTEVYPIFSPGSHDRGPLKIISIN